MKTILAFSMPGGMEWLVIGLIIIIFFGAKRIPDIARGLGRGIREFKDATKEIKKEIEKPAEGSSTQDNTTARNNS